MFFRLVSLASLVLSTPGIIAQTPAPRPKFDQFEVATIKPVEHDPKGGRYLIMQGVNRFVGKDYTLKLLIAAAYSLNSREVSGGPGWLESDHFDIVALTPADVRPNHDEQMAMLRNLLADRFKLTFHREEKEFSIYELSVARGGPKLKASTAPPDDPPQLISTVFPQRILLPARNTTMGDFVSILQRAILDRPVVDKTGLNGNYDIKLSYAPEGSTDSTLPSIFTAVQEQLGLKLEPAKVPVEMLVIDHVEKVPTEN